MSLESVKNYFEVNGLKDRITVFDKSSATVELAAAALGCYPARIAKTLSFRGLDFPVIIVAAGDVRVDNKKFRAEFGLKPRMLDVDEVVELVGHEVGGVCPFLIKEGPKIYLDVSLRRFDTVFPACGSSNSAVELSIGELEMHSNYSRWVDVCVFCK